MLHVNLAAKSALTTIAVASAISKRRKTNAEIKFKKAQVAG